ncbi:hypothetical protein SARC_01321 [Sphaeroforma arctica JP610]|uniref:Uncharacterized protein n=1 Tax=Sphaeroforma arctica JP610 TaxID=667725 RepID=A0A0L0GE65_9EUKA|nr:hypothetical protein SARC_01321 [Sphaeroforma arctica JP610]KNC86548.1 hypothetical protein SARC_01321 [Sphaeroforma arctica JP610]|eukprot:XP_014160450.1 hypothetical protein SARC_01321 [Sphaeroforma arctica JP610]
MQTTRVDISAGRASRKALSTNALAPKKAKSNKVWVRYTPNPLVVLYTPSPRQPGTSASPSKTPLKALAEYKDRLLTCDQVEIIKVNELAAPATKLASDIRERDARTPKGYPSIIDADYSEKCGIFHGSNRTRIDAYDFSDHNDIDLKNTSTGSIHAIVLLLAGDSAARMGIALVQSLHNVNTCPGIDIVAALVVGGVGSEECKRTGKTKCSSLSPTAFSDVCRLPT